MYKKTGSIFAAVLVSTILLGIGSITSVAYAQVEEQEGNLKGKIAKMQDVIDTCDQKAEAGTLGTSPVKEDCFKVIDAFN
jgi:hypothetical protein